MILLGSEILKRVLNDKIKITPFNIDQVNPNSYDLRLDSQYLIYRDTELDAAKINTTISAEIPPEGLLLLPNELYIMQTQEITETDCYVPGIEGRSSVGRLGIDVHATAGFGDLGFKGRWTLEVSVKKPVRIYAGMRICQIYFMQFTGEPTESDFYKGKYVQQYIPRPSYIWKEREEWVIKDEATTS